MLNKRPLSLAVSAAIGASAYLGMAPANAQDDQLVEEVVVTGSRIQRANLVSSSPVTQLDAEELRFTGLTRVEDALAAIPAISLDQSSGQAIEATGTATLQLRNLGAQRTLVLMNGRRLPANSPSGGSASSAADVNLIPGQLVERVEVLTGGASSTYGADAVAGVVNFIMIDDFEGIKIDGQFGQFRSDQEGGLVADAAQRAGQPFATGTQNDGDQYDFTAIMGGNFDNGRGNATAFITYRDIEGVTQLQRDTSACPVRASGECLGSGTNQSGSWIFPDISPTNYRTEGNEFLEGRGPGFNFAAPSFFQRPDRRTVLGTFAHYDISEQAEAYTELLFMDTKSNTQFGPAGVFFQTFEGLNCDNPLLSDQQRGVVGCDGPDDTYTAVLGRRNVEGGPRRGALRHSTYRGVFGLRGDINETWRYDVSYQYAEVDMANFNTNYVDVGRVRNALEVVEGPDGTPVCAVGGECVPYDVFSTGGVAPGGDASTDYFSQEVFESGRTTQEVLMAYVQGSLGDYGVASPFAESGVELVVGAEYREESLTYDVSDNAKRGEAGGFGVPVPVSGRYDVNEFYFEANIPIIEDVALIQSLNLDVGYRYSDYSFGVSTDTFKFAGSWAVNDEVKLRGSFQRAVRAPNIVDLFRPEGGSLFAMDRDPCNKANPGDATSLSGYTFEQCARSGVTRAIWDIGGPEDSPAAQYNDIEGGSTELQPEESDTYTAGIIWTPGFIDGLVVSADWYDIEITDAITGINAETTLIQCIETGDPLFCDAISRGLNDTLWLGQAELGVSGIDARSTNIGFYKIAGVDVEVRYNFDVGDMGTVNLSSVAGFVTTYEQEEYPGAGVIECDGFYGGGCGIPSGTPTPDFRNRFQATWATPWNVTASLIWRHTSGIDQKFTDVPNDIDAFDYFDISANWDVTDYATLRLGINNVFDEKPPFVYQGVTARENGNTYPGIYDPLGQYLFVGGTVQF